MNQTFRNYILPHIPIIGVIFIASAKESILDQEERPITYFVSAISQAVGISTIMYFMPKLVSFFTYGY